MSQTIFADQKVTKVQEQFHMISLDNKLKSAPGKTGNQMNNNMLLLETAQADSGKAYGQMAMPSKHGLNQSVMVDNDEVLQLYW